MRQRNGIIMLVCAHGWCFKMEDFNHIRWRNGMAFLKKGRKIWIPSTSSKLLSLYPYLLILWLSFGHPWLSFYQHVWCVKDGFGCKRKSKQQLLQHIRDMLQNAIAWWLLGFFESWYHERPWFFYFSTVPLCLPQSFMIQDVPDVCSSDIISALKAERKRWSCLFLTGNQKKFFTRSLGQIST